MADGNIKVSIEAVVHKGIKDLLQSVYNEHKIKVNIIRVDWYDINPILEPFEAIISETRIETSCQ